MSARSGWITRPDRAVVWTGAAVLTGLAWLYLIRMGSPAGMPAAHGAAHHGSPDLASAVLMWSVMMVAMMLPAALPYVFAFDGEMARKKAPSGRFLATGIFLAGYFTVWTVFSAGAAYLQLGLVRASLLTHSLDPAHPVLAGSILMAAGVYQWTSMKDACLRHCRSPIGFLLSEWREGLSGAFSMGVRHGILCTGCCWLLMLIPFAAGVMDLFWMAAVAVFVLVEKAAPGGQLLGRIVGALLVVLGAAVLLRFVAAV